MAKNHDIIELQVLIKRSTEKAIMVENLKRRDVWLPKSQVEIDGPTSRTTIQLPEWLAIDKELV